MPLPISSTSQTADSARLPSSKFSDGSLRRLPSMSASAEVARRVSYGWTAIFYKGSLIVAKKGQEAAAVRHFDARIEREQFHAITG